MGEGCGLVSLEGAELVVAGTCGLAVALLCVVGVCNPVSLEGAGTSGAFVVVQVSGATVAGLTKSATMS